MTQTTAFRLLLLISLLTLDVSIYVITQPNSLWKTTVLNTYQEVFFYVHGDAAMNGIPSLRKITIWIEDKNAFQNSWNILIDEKANWIYPAHGKPFRPDDLKKNINYIRKIKLYKLK